MKKIICLLGAITILFGACSTTQETYQVTEAPVLSAYYSDWDRAVRADVDMQNMYIGTPSSISKPIDMYMAMALAIKYNYTRRLSSYKENILNNEFSLASLPKMAENLGYSNYTNSTSVPADLKVSWNLLDISSNYYQKEVGVEQIALQEENRKVINNILQETRGLYWKALAAQRLIPVIDDMNEYLVRSVDEFNARTKELAADNKKPSTNILLKKRKYLEFIKDLSEVRRTFELAQSEFVSFLGLYPTTEIKLAGSEYGNFAIPSLRAKTQQLEWLALTNRPELRVFDINTSKEELELVIKEFESVENSDYRQNPNYYNSKWSKNSREFSMNLFEDIRDNSVETYNSLARQRVTNIIISQVYLSWAMYQSAVEDYLLNMGVASISEDIAEEITIAEGASKTVSHLESARAIIDEANAFLSYIDVQEAIGSLYASIGMDPIPADMIHDTPSVLAVQIRKTLTQWNDGLFVTNENSQNVTLSMKKPPIDVSSRNSVPDVVVAVGDDVQIAIPDDVFAKINWEGEYKVEASSLDDMGLPEWLYYDEETKVFSGHPTLDDTGNYKINLYASDSSNNSAVLTFSITVKNMYIKTMNYKGWTDDENVKVYHKCTPGKPCLKDPM